MMIFTFTFGLIRVTLENKSIVREVSLGIIIQMIVQHTTIQQMIISRLGRTNTRESHECCVFEGLHYNKPILHKKNVRRIL